MSYVEDYGFCLVPYDEQEAQVHFRCYFELARLQGKAMLAQLKRKFGEPPAGSKLKIGRYTHEFGTGYEIDYRFDHAEESHIAYFVNLDECWPQYWDDEAKEFLRAYGHDQLVEINKQHDEFVRF